MSEQQGKADVAAGAAQEAGGAGVPAATGARGYGWALLALLAAGAAGFLYYHFNQRLALRTQEVRAEVEALRAQVAEMDKRLSQTAGAAQSLEAKLGQLREETSRVGDRLAEAMARFAAEQERDDSRWVLREAHYLLTVAQQRLLLERDVATATAAVEAADWRLAEAGEATFIPIREQIVADLNALRAIKPVDVAGMSLYLADLIDRVEPLPLKGGGYEVEGEQQASPQRPPVADWRELPRALWRDLVQLVDVKRSDVPDDLIFDPEKRQALQQGLRVELASARLMALRHDTENFRASITHVEQALNRYYDTQSPEVTDILARLAAMREAELAPALPDLERSARALRAAVERRATPEQ